MASSPLFLPAPRSVEMTAGSFALSDRRLILLEAAHPQELLFSATLLKEVVHETHGLDWQMAAGAATPSDLVAVTLRVKPSAMRHAQGYRLTVTPQGVVVDAHDAAGVYYAVCTLRQLVQQSDASLPCLVIEDWPDFPARGVMLDISRDRVPTMDTLFDLVDMLASWKVNQLQLYTEHTFAYRRHPDVWAAASPMTGFRQIHVLGARERVDVAHIRAVVEAQPKNGQAIEAARSEVCLLYTSEAETVRLKEVGHSI